MDSHVFFPFRNGKKPVKHKEEKEMPVTVIESFLGKPLRNARTPERNVHVIERSERVL